MSSGADKLSDSAVWWGGLILIAVLSVFVVGILIRLFRFAREYRELSARLGDGAEAPRIVDHLSPGYTYATASRGPGHARDAEMDSAEARWRHFSMAFPQQAGDQHGRRVLIAKRAYTGVTEVNTMQDWLVSRIAAHARRSGRVPSYPKWIEEMENAGEDFDALRHPQLAIANPALYTFPFLLTWQRRHLWGVLPYAVHTQLGLVCRKCYPEAKREALEEVERVYSEALENVRHDQSALWINDPKHLSWLSLILKSTKDSPVYFKRDSDVSICAQHKSATVISIGAYLHKELIPLASAMLPDPGVAADYAEFARELDVPDVLPLLKSPSEWPQDSVMIVDLAVLPTDWITPDDPEAVAENAGNGIDRKEWSLFRVPHCVYVPVGIGYSIPAVPMLLEDREWRNRTLRDVGDELLGDPADKLAKVGIQVDERFWLAD